MNTKNLKAYAPKARKQFIEAIKKRAAHFGIYEDRIAEVRIEGGAAIIEGRAFTRKEGEQRKRLESKIAERASATYQEKYDMFTREMAYTWFNRLAALRYMEIHDYFDHGFRVLSPAKNHPTNADSLPEILNHASDVAESLNLDKDHIIELQLAGDKEEELYRELLLGQCHQLAKIMPQIFKGLAFETIDDATELLLPNNLTKTDSILKGLINDIPEEDWQDIEVIGWLYQFYISEHKDSVIGKVVKSEDIPAATQLFTPNWIVKYLVQNSVGRQWLATYPDSELKGKMEYYIEPAEQSEDVIEQLKAITPTSIDPEEIKVLDPACGSGHILVEVYEILREIYLERGYRIREIPELILTKNIYGLDIDDRAAQLAGFALMMKAREDDRRIFQRVEGGEVSLNVFSLQSTEHLDIPKLWKAIDIEGTQQTGTTGGLFEDTEEFVQPTGVYKEYFELLQMLKSAFLHAKMLGSLIEIEHCDLTSLIALNKELESKLKGTDPAASQASHHLISIVKQAIVLAQKYDSVVANPPYMGSNYQILPIKKYLKENFSGFDKDLFSAFIVRNLSLAKENGQLGFMTPYVWMFLSSYEPLRELFITRDLLSTLVQLEYSGFDGATVPICAFTLSKLAAKDQKGSFIRLAEFKGSSNQAPRVLEAVSNKNCGWYYESSSSLYGNLPGKPIAYWITEEVGEIFTASKRLGNFAGIGKGLDTGDNNRFLRYWFEVSSSSPKWIPLQKGGPYRKWYGNNEFVINWESNGKELKEFKGSNLRNSHNYFKNGLSWTRVSSGTTAFRYFPDGYIFESTGPCIFVDELPIWSLSGFLNSKVTLELLSFMAPTLDFQSGHISALPILNSIDWTNNEIQEFAKKATQIAKEDWDSFETSMDYVKLHLEGNSLNRGLISESLKQSCNYWDKQSQLLASIEEENNSFFVAQYGLSKFIKPSVNLEKITLNRNPAFKNAGDADKVHSDNIVEVLSYAIGNMMGRYSLDRDGLVYAHSGNESFKQLEADGAYKSFPADDDGIIPLASEEWLFDDDATTRFKEFVNTVWDDEHLSENLEFVAESLCLHALKPLSTKKGGAESAMDTVRRYFSTQFFKDHCKTYKKRPIYWLFSSGKEKAFECLVYLHRYNEGTLSRMRTEYVTPLMGKYEGQHTLLSEQQLQATGTEARTIEKDLKSLEKKQAELRTFDEQLKHYAEKRITLDLDDGVKANYGKFGNLLADVKAIHGKAVK
jgi:type II restriction/modification system DNA methylase subunit YeeA